MATVSAESVRKLRQLTGAGILDCQKALQESNGDLDKATQILREKGIVQAGKRALRTANEGTIVSYIHPGGKLGVLVELNCETDFVARTDEFQGLAKELALQIAGANPQWISREDVPPEILDREKQIYRTQVAAENKPEPVIDRIVTGRLDKFYQEMCLLDQMHLRDSSGKTTVKDLLTNTNAKLGENIIIRRFVRFRIGEETHQ